MHIRTLMAIVGVSTAAAYAQVVFTNPWDAGAHDGGSFSDHSQVLAGEFDLTGPANVEAASWRGTMFSPDPLNTGDTWQFDVLFYNDNSGKPGAPFASRSVIAAVTDTGVDLGGERVYGFDATFAPVALAGNTTYFFTALNTGTQTTFRWNWGTDTNYSDWKDQSGGTGAWTSMGPVPLSFQLSVPAPGSLALLGLGGLVAARPRRA